MTILTTSSINSVGRATTSSNIYRVQTSTASAPSTEVPPVAPATAPAQALSAQLEEVQHAINLLKQSIKPTLANGLEFQIDQSSGRTLVKILDKETNTVVRQIPSEEMLTIAHALDRMQGRGGLVRQKA
jgi:flagellar protein FlaG